MKNKINKLKDYAFRIIQIRIVFLLIGLVSTIWFLFRVIPKPSRAAYPCMKATAPIMSAFVLYLLSIATAVFAIKKFKWNFVNNRYTMAFGFIAIAILSFFISGLIRNESVKAVQLVNENSFTPNDPIGTARGLNPGRVVWVWNTNATNENCTNTAGDYWFDNTDADEVDSMLSRSILDLTDKSDLNEAWDAIFKYFNTNHGRGNVGYTSGEKIYIKINITNSCCSVSGTTKTGDFARMDATPELSLALLRQLIDVVGVAQSDIYLGDPFRTFHDLYWDVCHSVYPNVNYCDELGINGRHKTVATDTAVLKFSDGQHLLRIPKEYMEATYFINMPCLKTHNEGGITLTAKNHQGSILEMGTAVDNQSAQVMHYSLAGDDQGYGKYRHLVDYMGHNRLGGNTLLFIVDGIWAGRNWEGQVDKWLMAPFNNDYPNSLFISQDEVAIQSVCFDFLLEEYKNKASNIQYPYIEGTDDFLLQAADPSYWPSNIEYDPEGDGTIIGSLGVYEHWNNATDREYTRNLNIGNGIELVTDTMGPISQHTSIENDFKIEKADFYVYPNPASKQINIDYFLTQPSKVSIEIYSNEGSKIGLLECAEQRAGEFHFIHNIESFPKGVYLVRMEVSNKNESTQISQKVIIR